MIPRQRAMLLSLCWIGSSQGFFAPIHLPRPTTRRTPPLREVISTTNQDDSLSFYTHTTLSMAKRKPSMAERRKRRAARNKTPQSSSSSLPECKLDFKTKKPISISGEGDMIPTSETTTTTTEGLDASKKITDPTLAKTKAQQLIDAQRDSIAMLTHVTEKIRELPTTLIRDALEETGYIVIDGFLGRSTDYDAIPLLRDEGRSMLANMEADLTNLGSGEYTVALKGGEDQYTQCPRSVEFVVSTTKHMVSHLGLNDTLDDGASMATLRTFDRKAFKASLALLTGKEDEDLVGESTKPFGIIATEENDQRRITLMYYIVSSTWDSSNCGGGLTFEGDGATVEAKSDRLVILKSDTCSFRRDPWKGSDAEENMTGTCLELHLVLKNEQEEGNDKNNKTKKS